MAQVDFTVVQHYNRSV